MLSTPPQIVARRMRGVPARIVELSGEHDASTVPELERTLRLAVAGGDAVIVDLRRVTFADSAILASIVKTNGDARLCCFAVVLPPPGAASRLLGLVDARAVLRTFPTMSLAIKWCYPALEPQHDPI